LVAAAVEIIINQAVMADQVAEAAVVQAVQPDNHCKRVTVII
jgi:hypothetical protein